MRLAPAAELRICLRFSPWFSPLWLSASCFWLRLRLWRGRPGWQTLRSPRSRQPGRMPSGVRLSQPRRNGGTGARDPSRGGRDCHRGRHDQHPVTSGMCTHTVRRQTRSKGNAQTRPANSRCGHRRHDHSVIPRPSSLSAVDLDRRHLFCLRVLLWVVETIRRYRRRRLQRGGPFEVR